jgi:hypothetical protein
VQSKKSVFSISQSNTPTNMPPPNFWEPVDMEKIWKFLRKFIHFDETHRPIEEWREKSRSYHPFGQMATPRCQNQSHLARGSWHLRLSDVPPCRNSLSTTSKSLRRKFSWRKYDNKLHRVPRSYCTIWILWQSAGRVFALQQWQVSADRYRQILRTESASTSRINPVECTRTK